MQKGITIKEDIVYQSSCEQETETFNLSVTVKVTQKENEVDKNDLTSAYSLANDELFETLSRAFGIKKK